MLEILAVLLEDHRLSVVLQKDVHRALRGHDDLVEAPADAQRLREAAEEGQQRAPERRDVAVLRGALDYKLRIVQVSAFAILLQPRWSPAPSAVRER